MNIRKLDSNSQIKYGALLSYLGIAAYILIGLFYTPWMVHTIGKDDYGLYTLAYSIIAFFLFDFGLSATVQRFVAKFLAEGNNKGISRCVGQVFKLYLLIDIVILVVLAVVYLCIPSIYRELTPEQIERLKVVYTMAGAFSVLSFPCMPLNGILSAYEKFVQLKSIELLQKVCTVLVIVLCLHKGGGLYELVTINIIGGVVAILLKLLAVFKGVNLKVDFTYTSLREMKNVISFAGWTTVVALCQRVIFNIAPSILAVFVGAEVIAIFGIAISLEAYTFTFASALNGLFLPKISRIINNDGDVLPLMIKVGRVQIILLGVLILGFAFVGKDFIHAWMGEGFEDAYLCTLLLIIPAFFLLPADVAEQTLIASGKVKYRAEVYVIMALANVVLSFALTSIWGIRGMALSIFIAYMIRTFALYVVYKKKLNIDVKSFIKSSFLKMLPALLVAFVACFAACSFAKGAGWNIVLIKCIIVLVAYAASMWLIAMNDDEKQLFINMFKRLVK